MVSPRSVRNIILCPAQYGLELNVPLCDEVKNAPEPNENEDVRPTISQNESD